MDAIMLQRRKIAENAALALLGKPSIHQMGIDTRRKFWIHFKHVNVLLEQGVDSPHFEEMNDGFHKWHLQDLGFPAAIHMFSEPDMSDPHDHPFDFQSDFLLNGYTEEVFHRGAGLAWHKTTETHREGDTISIKAAHIHRITEIERGICVTLIRPTPHLRTSRVWRFDHSGVSTREWSQKDFRPVELMEN